MNIDQFKAVISDRGGLAVQNRFSLVVTPPRAARLEGRETGEDINLLCESCSLPGRIVNTQEFQLLQNSFKVPTGHSVEDVTFTFLLTNDYFAKKVFDAWINQVVDFDNYRVRYLEDYRGEILINQLTKGDTSGKEQIVETVRLIDAYPTTIGAIALDNTAENTVQRLTVTVAYRNFEIF